MTTPPTRDVDRKTFLAYVRQSGLISDAQLAFVKKNLPLNGTADDMANALVELRLLTRFQAERIKQGRTAGFVLGQYKILDQLGKGGMGRVFRAEHLTMKRLVALKVLAPDLIKTERAQEMFLREVRAISQLVHPNIVTAFDANEVNGRYYLILEYIDGPNLEQLVRKQGPLSVGLACDYVCQIANGLQCAHALGMVHRDIKPANIMIQRRGTDPNAPGLVKISDFGLARLQAPQSVDASSPRYAGTILCPDNKVMGTPDYLSPEQARNLHGADIRSDLYSLGCTFYYLLTGRVVFPGGTGLEKVIRHSTEMPEQIDHFRQDVPPTLIAILYRLLAKHPADRFQTPAELAKALEPFAVSGPIPWAPQVTFPMAIPMGPAPGAKAAPLALVPGALTPSALTPAGEAAGSSEDSPSDELAALTNTMPPSPSPTPVGALPVVRAKTESRPEIRKLTSAEKHRRQIKTAMIWAVSIVFGAISIFAILSLFLGRR